MLGDAAAQATSVLAAAKTGIYADGSRVPGRARAQQPAVTLPYRGSRIVA